MGTARPSRDGGRPPLEGAPSVSELGVEVLDASGEKMLCAICMISTKLLDMPCCGRDTATTRFCPRCIQLVCQQDAQHVGSCPMCRASIIWSNGGVSKNTRLANCKMCCQPRVITGNNMCSACAIGAQRPLAYECSRCHGHQRIPHPMYRYQPSPQEFGGTSWACHMACDDFTMWRVVPEELHLVPTHDAPQSWGLVQANLVQIREQRQSEESG